MIKKLAVPFALVAVATLAACAAGPGTHDTVVSSGYAQPGYYQGAPVPAGYVIGGYVQPSYVQPRYEQATYIQPTNGQPGYTVYGPIPIPGAARTGKGKIALLTDLSGPVADVSTQRVTLRMNDGVVQTIDVRGEQLKMGEEIAIRSDSTIRREPSN
jgi:hypothetical protein